MQLVTCYLRLLLYSSYRNTQVVPAYANSLKEGALNAV